jgi:polysaccharide biosynthesis protein PslG
MFYVFLIVLICILVEEVSASVGMGYNSLAGWDVGVTNGRIWDMGAAWNQIHMGVDTYNWDNLDAIVGQMQSLGMSITYVISACPQWLAKYPNNPYPAPWLGPGSNSMPSDMDEANKFFWNLSTRYAGRIQAYEIWNEPQLSDFLYPYNDVELGDLATMTKRAYSTIKTCDGGARIVAASLLPRASSGGMSKASKYLDAIRANGWNVDLFNCHIYPNIGEGPDVWGSMLSDCRGTIASYGAPSGEVWVTETNFDLLGSTISEEAAPGYVDGAYAQAGAQGVTEVYWYGWDTTASLGGLDIRSGTSAWAAIKNHGAQMQAKASVNATSVI